MQLHDRKKHAQPGVPVLDAHGACILEHMYDFASRTETRITTDQGPADVAISGDRIVCQDIKSGNPDIWLFGLSGTVVQVILPISGQVEASLANGSISNAGIAHPLEALLRQSSAAIVRGKDNAARATLGAFIRLVRGQSGKGIDAAAAQVLIDSAQDAIDALTV